MLYIYITGYVLIWPIRAFLLCVCKVSTFLFLLPQMRFKIYLPLIRWKWAYDGHLWRRSSNEGSTFAKGMWRVIRETSIEQMITRSFDQGEKADGQNKTMWPKGTGHSNAIRAAVQLCWRWCDIQQAPELLWTKRGWLTEPLQITVIWLSNWQPIL